MTVRYLAVVAVVCLFVEEMTTPLPTMAKLSYIGMNTYIHRDVFDVYLDFIHICICIYVYQSLFYHMAK